LHIQNAVKCDGSIDFVNGSSPGPVKFSAGALLSVYGWLAMSAENGIVADKVMLVLTDVNGQRSFIETRQTSRPDVGDAFKKRQLDLSGYSATTDILELKGHYSLGLAYEHNGAINICPQFNIPGDFKGN
jgi:hypothetical protein